MVHIEFAVLLVLILWLIAMMRHFYMLIDNVSILRRLTEMETRQAHFFEVLRTALAEIVGPEKMDDVVKYADEIIHRDTYRAVRDV